MNQQDKTWESVKSEYLKQIEKELAMANHPRAGEIIEDVTTHLDRRYEELSEDQHTWENYQTIITDMGPASDYAELLDDERRQEPSKISKTFVIGTVVVFTLIAVLLIALPYLQNKNEQAWPISAESELPHPFEDDPQVIGRWKSVDFVRQIEDFQPGVKLWQGDLFLKQLVFTPSGATSIGNTWTKGWIYTDKGKIKAEYKIVELQGQSYMFFPWLSGDVTIRGRKPCYYVLQKQDRPVKSSERQESK